MRPERSGRLATAAGAVALVLLTSGCLLNDKTQAGQTLHNAPKVLSRSPSVAITVQFASRLIRRGSLATLPQPDPGLTLSGVFDPRTGRGYYTTGGSKKPAVVFDGNTLFALIPSAKPDDARPWISAATTKKLNDYVLDPSSVPGSLAAFALRPTLLLDLFAGALTGSIQKVGPATVDGVTTTEYKAKFIIDQAIGNSTRVTYSQKQWDNLDKLFKILGIQSGDLDSGVAWVDAQGNPRELALAIQESPADQSKMLLFVDVHLTPQDVPADVPIPNANSVETVPSLNQYLLPLKALLPAAAGAGGSA